MAGRPHLRHPFPGAKTCIRLCGLAAAGVGPGSLQPGPVSVDLVERRPFKTSDET